MQEHGTPERDERKELEAAWRLGEIRAALREVGFDDLTRMPSRNAQVRELLPVLRGPGRDALARAWQHVLDVHGPTATGVQVRSIVRGLPREEVLPLWLTAFDDRIVRLSHDTEDVEQRAPRLKGRAPAEIIERWCRELQESSERLARAVQGLGGE